MKVNRTLFLFLSGFILFNAFFSSWFELPFQIIWVHGFFYKKLGSAPSTKSFLISHENFAIIVLKVS